MKKSKVIIVEFRTEDVVKPSTGYEILYIKNMLIKIGSYRPGNVKIVNIKNIDEIELKYLIDENIEWWVILWSECQVREAFRLGNTIRGKGYFVTVPVGSNYEKIGRLERFNDFGLLLRQEVMDASIEYLDNDEIEAYCSNDSDLHFGEYKVGGAFPLQLSRGCVNRCEYCPTNFIFAGKRIMVSEEKIEEVIKKSVRLFGKREIHFMDEDFFNVERKRLYKIIKILGDEGIRWVCLSTVRSIRRLERIGIKLEELKDAGLVLIELGLESTSSEVREKVGANNKVKKVLYEVAEDVNNVGIKIIWLNMTYLPMQKIKDIYLTGEFIRRYGIKAEELHYYIRENGTWGGLGLFTISYLGFKHCWNGVKLGWPYQRLEPSFIPDSILKSRVRVNFDNINRDVIYWFNYYSDMGRCGLVGWDEGKEIIARMDGKFCYEIIKEKKDALVLALAARHGVVKEKE